MILKSGSCSLSTSNAVQTKPCTTTGHRQKMARTSSLLPFWQRKPSRVLCWFSWSRDNVFGWTHIWMLIFAIIPMHVNFLLTKGPLTRKCFCSTPVGNVCPWLVLECCQCVARGLRCQMLASQMKDLEVYRCCASFPPHQQELLTQRILRRPLIVTRYYEVGRIWPAAVQKCITVLHLNSF